MAESPRRVQIVPSGPLVDGVEVDVKSTQEPWSEYQLDDGTTIRVRQVVIEVVRTNDQYDPEGNRLYVIKAQPVISVSANEKFRRK